MLKGISPLLSPELLATLCAMGHGDEILLADAHFPCYSFSHKVIRADGLGIANLLEGILPLFELDAYVPHPVITMEAVKGDTLDPHVESEYSSIVHQAAGREIPFMRMERFAFYERVRGCHAVIATGDVRKYANIILKKGVTPV